MGIGGQQGRGGGAWQHQLCLHLPVTIPPPLAPTPAHRDLLDVGGDGWGGAGGGCGHQLLGRNILDLRLQGNGLELGRGGRQALPAATRLHCWGQRREVGLDGPPGRGSATLCCPSRCQDSPAPSKQPKAHPPRGHLSFQALESHASYP